MNFNKFFIIIHLLLFSFCLCDISLGHKEKLLNGFINYYNNLPNQIYTCNERSLQQTQQVDETTYQIVVAIKVTEIRNIEVTKSLKCTATVQDSDNGIAVTSNNCQEQGQQSPGTGSQEQVTEALVEVAEPTVERKPVQLVNEVQSDTAITSGEQFIAIPRDQPSAPCIGCASHVNPQAAGVSDLANLGIRHLDIHQPSVKHSLDSVLDVERQVQVVNGVRYILTLSVLFNNCSVVDSEDCASSKTCKITILVKPRVKLPNGANYRAILANNCTEEWQYGDNGEVLPEVSPDNRSEPNNKIKGNTNVDDVNGSDGDIQAKYNTEVQSQPNQERSLTDEEISNLQDQIIPNDRFEKITEPNRQSVTISPDMPNVSKQHVFKVESPKHSENSIPITESGTLEQTINLNPDKKKAIDDMLDFFDFSGFKPKTEVEEVIPRVRRSYDYDLQVLSLAEDFHGIKKSIENARFIYDIAQAMVDYLNEMDMEVKNRAVKNVIKAEEEIENLQRFVYVQARVTIPCDKAECEPKDEVTQICNGVLDSTNENRPQILNTFCYNDNKERNYREAIKEIYPDDPVLQKLATEALKKIESESKSQYAMKINKIVSANIQKTTGTLTKFSIIIDYIKCNKSVPLALRINCTVLEQLGTNICEVIIHEIHWLKERKISYTCTDRPVDMRMSKAKSILKNETKLPNDPKIIEMLQEAIQYLETQSNKNNKQKIVSIKSISSQIIAGFLTKIEFVVGFTNCTDGNYAVDELNKCELLNNEGLRLCRAQIWDRSWIMDGRQVEVSCDDVEKNNEIQKTRKKRSIDIGQEPQSVNDSNNQFFKLANESLKKFLHASSSRQHYEVVKIDRVTVQDVPGKLTRLEFSISPTNCVIQSDGHPSLSKCDIVNSKSIFRCRSKVLNKVWLDKKQYFVNCNTKDQKLLKEPHLDGLKKHNPRDAKYYQLAEESLRKYLNDTGNSPHHKIIRVDKVTTQIVSGLLTSIDFKMTQNNQSDSESNSISCHSEILEKHWLGTKEFNVTCQMKEKKKTHDSQELNPHNPIYMQIAVESLQKYIRNKPDSHLVRVTFVDKVIQMGEITKIIFIASHKEDDDGDTLCQAEFSEQELFRSDIEVKCYSIGTVLKTEITEKDPKYFKYLHLAEDSLNYYLQSINSSQEYTIINIENVTIMWDDGINTLINFIISPIDLDATELHGQRCYSQIREQPWLQKKHKEVKCEVDKDLYRMKRQVLNVRKKRQLGGLEEEDPTKPQYRVLAEESLRKYVDDTGIKQPLEVVVVEKVFTQVISGSKTYIDFIVSGSQDSVTRKCNSEVWEQAWLNKKEIKVSCHNANQRVKRDTIFGGKTEQDPTDHQYRALAEESLQKYVDDTGIKQPLTVFTVEKVFTQLVSGLLTYIDFTVSGSQDSNAIKCNSEVWEQAWLNKKEIKVSCHNANQRVKREHLVGGKTERDPTEPQYRALAEESLQKYVDDTGIKQPLRVFTVEKVFTQLVSGLLTYIDFTVSGSQDSNAIKCNSEVWEQAWLNKKEIKVSCHNVNRRVKREHLVGGKTERDPTEPQYRLLAEESLRKYVDDTGIKQPLEVVVVEKVFTQVVSGSKTYIDFIVSGSQDSDTRKCNSEVWEQAWLNRKEIKVSCHNANQRVKREHLVGGKAERDPTEPQYRALAEESLQKYVDDTGIKQPLRVFTVEKVFTQLVSGLLTYIDFTVSGSQDSNAIKCNSEVWEQAWLNKKEIKVSCHNVNRRVKREHLVGGKTERDPTEPQYRLLAEESLRKYVDDTGIKQPLRVFTVEKVFTQLVSGLLTYIDFTVSGSQDSNAIKCNSEVWEQAWLNKKEIKVSCHNANQRVKREHLVGGKTERDPTEPQYRALAEESLQKYVDDTGIKQPLTVFTVEKVFTQVVSGSKTYIDFIVSGSQDSDTRKCNSEVWEQAWLNKKEIKVSCHNANQRVKREHLVGGKAERDPTEPQYRALAEESLQKYVDDTGIKQPLRVFTVEKVFTQLVSGLLTYIDFTVSGSQDSNAIKCNSEVWEQAWLNKKEIKVSCHNVNRRVKREHLVGGKTERDPTEPQYRLLAEESLRKYVDDTGIKQPLEVVVVEKVFTQVVSGSKTYIDFIVSGSQDSDTRKCNSEVWEQAWLNKKEIIVSCHNANQRVKRDTIYGGKTEQDPTGHQYRALAEESLQKYVDHTGIKQPLEVVVVEKVFTQVVSGLMTYIDFTVSGSQDSDTRKCNSEVWEQAWLNKKEIKVSCHNANQRVKKEHLVGGKTEQNPTEPQYRALAEESLRKYVDDTGIKQPLRVFTVEKVFTQLVSGLLTSIDFIVSGSQDSNTIKCNAEIWEQAWLNKKEIKVSCHNVIQRVKRENLVGGKMEQNPTEPQYRALAEESLRKYVDDTGTKQPLEVVVVEKVFTQVVSGSKTYIDFIVSGSQDSNTIKCNAEIWEQAWLNKKEIKVSCHNVIQRVKRENLVGGKMEQNPTQPQYRALAEESLRKYVDDTGIKEPLEVVVVEKVFTQVVSGSKTYIDFIVSGSQDSNTIKCNAEIWEQAWLNKKEIKVSCHNVNRRVKREHLVGGKMEQNPTEPQYRALAEESLRKYVDDTGIKQPLEVVVVEKVFTRVVSGSKTYIHFIVSGSQDSNTIKCNAEIWEQAWLNKKEIKVSCHNVIQRVKREHLLGGKTEQNPTKPQYRVLAEESLRKYVDDTGIKQPLEVVVVEKVFTQVVSGSKTYIDFIVSGNQDSNTIKCNAEIWEQAWLNKKEIKVSCHNVIQRVKRENLVGGKMEQNPTEPQYRALAEESLRKYVDDTGIKQPLEVVVVEKVFTQVVSGSKTYIDFIVSGSQDSNTIKCNAEIWEQAWLNKKEIKVSCHNVIQRVKRENLVGGKTEQNPTEPQYRALAEESLRKYVDDTGIKQPLELVVVEKVFTQVVSGSKTYIDFIVSSSQDSNTIKCNAEIWEQAWLNKKEIKVSCHNVIQRVKRENLVGGKMEQNPTEPQYKALAEESLRKYVDDTGIKQPLEVVVVEKVFTQVVSGSKTYIDFIVSGSQDSNTIKCNAEIWEQAWLNKKEINVSCQNANQRVKRQIFGVVKEMKGQLHTGSPRGHAEDEQDPNKPEYRRLAEESLRKYEKKSNIYHKVVEVKRVVTRVVSGLKYNIEFSAAPTVCSVNVTKVHARSCKAMDDVLLYCHTKIWDRPWLKQKNIDIQCYGPGDDDLEEYESDSDPVDNTKKSSDLKNKNDEKYKTLAEEASEKYLTSSNRKYVHKVTDIHSVSEHIANGTVTKIEYSLSPTTCIRNQSRGSNGNCVIKQPLIVFHCNATVWDQPSLHLEKDIKVTCKKNSRNKSNKNYKLELGVRTKRQIGEDDDEIDEDTTYYYADRAVQHVNDQSSSNNLHKLISIHAVQNSVQMGATTVQMYIEIAETFCLRHHKDVDLYDCEEMDGLNHRLCLARLWPSPDDELVVRHVSVVCDDEQDFQSVTGVNIPELLRLSIMDLERSPDNAYKLVHQGEPQVTPTLDSKLPFKIKFIVATTNCSKNVNLDKNPFQCYINTAIPSRACHSSIWLKAETKFIRYINAKCTPRPRSKRSILDPANVTLDNLEIQKLVTASLEKLEMSSLHRYKQRVLQINSHSTKITSGKVTTIDFDVGYTSCLKYEWVENITSCDFLEHLPRRRCVAQIWERLWIKNGKNIDVNCVDDETPLESHIEFESAEMANELAREALKHIEAKYPHPSKQKVVRIFSLEKQIVAGIHYRMKVEVGFTDCVALSEQTDCKLLKNMGLNKFCRVNVWVRPWTNHPPNFRVSCDFQESTTHDLYHHVQAEHLFYNFLTTYSPSYVNDYVQMQKRFEIFKKNIKKIHEFNVHEKGTARYGVTRFSDLTYEEFSSTYMGLKTNLRDANQIPIKKADIPDIKVPQNFDWREYDAVTDVKDQGSCGSCWAFSVTGNIEGQWKMQSGQLVSLSEQELVDCDKLDEGCNGGLPDNAYRAIEQMGGLELESDYPYEGEDDKCEFNKTLAKVQISGAVNITTNETGMAQWLVHNGPISIGINANAMQFYMGGISHPWKMLCNPTNLDHGVLIVGYGIKDYPLFHKQLPYWIVKNSWGKSWGEQGYYRVYRGDGTCGLNQMASSAVI